MLPGPSVRSSRAESGRPDLNRRPLGPQPSALPDCATPRGAGEFTPRWRKAGDQGRTGSFTLEG